VTTADVDALLDRYRARQGNRPVLYDARGQAIAVRNQYDSATTGRRARGWTAPTSGPNVATLGSLRALRDRSRRAYRDDPYAGGAIDHRVEQLVGCGIWPKSLAPEFIYPDGGTFRERVQDLFHRWSLECDADGLLDFAGLVTLATREWQEAGEVFVRKRRRFATDGLTVPLQLQVLEPELCPHDKTELLPNGAGRIRAGIEFSSIGARVGYHMYREHPGDGDAVAVTSFTTFRIDAGQVMHMFLPLRAGQIRGVPHLHRVLLTARDLEVGDDATLMRWGLANMLMAVFKRAPAGDPGVDPITGRPIERDANRVPMVTLEPGGVAEIGSDESLDFSEPPEAGNTYEAFMRQQLRKIGAGARTPYHAITGDMTQVNDRTIRVILQDFRRALEQLQWQVIIHQLCQPTWVAFVERAVLSGALVLPVPWQEREPWMAVEWAPDRWGYINPVQDIEADRAEIRAGMSSRTLKVKQRGYDVEEIDRQRAEDNAREDRLGLVSDSDPRKTSGTGLTQARPAGTRLPDAAPDPAEDAGAGA
jgi:lambda family phage portal protein